MSDLIDRPEAVRRGLLDSAPRPVAATVAWPPWRVDLFLPTLPAKALAPNGGRGHHIPHGLATHTLRAAAADLGRNYLREGGEAASNPTVGLLTGWLCYRRPTPPIEKMVGTEERPYRPTDPDDLLASCKAALDGLVDAEVLAEDRHSVLRLMAVEIHAVDDFAVEGLRFRFA